ncbi:MAG: helix-turn-helix domain-containing protein [Defluviitaleaceae bacterium]|nr:helix-turn-helix domain-containing protein [Defluviitaleaceae bacterium]
MNKELDMYERIGFRLSECRKNNRLSQSELSSAINIPQTTYANYELSKRKIPLNLLEKIANYYKLPIGYFLESNMPEIV